MPRVKRGVTARASHKKILKQAKGYYGARSRVFRVAKQAVIKAGQYAYRDRRQRKRQFRALWIARISHLITLKTQKLSTTKNNEFNNQLKTLLGKIVDDNEFKNVNELKNEELKNKIYSKLLKERN